MPAKRELQNKFKPHVGRIFSLRKVAIIPSYDRPKSAWNQQQQLLDRVSVLGEAVYIMDENNTRVSVLKIDGGTCWIPKYYLHKELITPNDSSNNKVDLYTENIVLLLSIAKKIRDNEKGNLSLKDAELIEDVAKDLRTITDIISQKK